MLIGVGGSGRQSLTLLAAHIQELKVCQIEVTKAYSVTEWREDMKQMLLQGGRDGNEMVFMFNDNQSRDFFYEDISNVLNHGASHLPDMRRSRWHSRLHS